MARLRRASPKADAQDASKKSNLFFQLQVGVLVLASTLAHVCLRSDTGLDRFLNSTWTLKQIKNASLESPTDTSTTGYAWDQGCMVGPKPIPPEPTHKAPTGLVIQLAKGTRKNGNAHNTMDLLCSKIPTQQAFFVEPQQLDLLILVALEGVSVSDIARCLELTELDISKKWTNLDGSTLWTNEFRSKSGRGTVFLAPYVMPYPEYIQKNLSILKEPFEACDGNHDYVQGCRFYSHEGLNLAIASNYEYTIKLDLDIEFNASVPFNLLHDMKMKGSILGHTAAFPDGFPPCTKDFKKVITTFAEEFGGETLGEEKWEGESQWKLPCSAGVPDFERGIDMWYTNFVVYRTDFFQSEPVRAFGRWMNEFYPGYFRYRWTDQLFFHHAMFLGPDFRTYVAFYTNLRCYRYETCWFFWAGNMNENNFCEKGGYFFHGKQRKKFGKFDWVFPDVTASLTPTPYVNHYEHNCTDLPD